MSLKLPFKPFTLDEVKQMTGIESRWVDRWVSTILPLRVGEEGLGLGWDWMQTFAAFVGWSYLKEGADTDRAEGIVHYVAAMSERQMGSHFAEGDTFPVPALMIKGCPGRFKGVMVHAPNDRLGQKLNLKVLYDEFHELVKKVFPQGAKHVD